MMAPSSASLSMSLARADALAHWETSPAWFGFLRANDLDPRELEPFAGTIGVAPCRFTPPPRRFRFDPDGAPAAFFEVLGIEDGEMIAVDLVAFDAAHPTIFGTLEGCGVMLGADQIENPSSYLGGRPLLVHRTPLSWLLAGCQGIVVLDERRGGARLAGALGNLAGEDEEHARQIARITAGMFSPRRIVFPRASASAA